MYIVSLDCFFLGEETLIMMTKDFDPILEFPCHSEEFGEGVFTVSFIIIHAVSFSNFSFQTLSSLLIMLNHEHPISLKIIIQHYKKQLKG